ncbi:MAG: metal-dependent transcriptional regulator [Candidatus Brockarchaeota archaeon]|nr:metal-dependent transcriptional regulator [Candidatus Brockarchaeota archaeon]MBO3808083.1 metal-dependent transcriptional regulator [Candidatus Brockarchaeota archaeon]
MPVKSSEEVTPVVEEYLECIYRLQEKEGMARTSSIVKSLRVAPGTVTNTVEKLEEEGLVTHVSYRGVKLTEKGRRIALQVVRRHRLSERLLVDILKMDWERVHETACRLEHSLTDEVVKHLEKALNYPKTCPHGNPVPNEQGKVFEEETQPLSKLAEGELGVIVKVVEEKPELLISLKKHGLVPGAVVRVLTPVSDEQVGFEVDGEKGVLSLSLASLIRVKGVEQ